MAEVVGRPIGGGDQHEAQPDEDVGGVTGVGAQAEQRRAAPGLAIADHHQHQPDGGNQGVEPFPGSGSAPGDEARARAVRHDPHRVDAEKQYEAENEQQHSDVPQPGRALVAAFDLHRKRSLLRRN